MQPPDQLSSRPTILRPKRLVKHPHQFLSTDESDSRSLPTTPIPPSVEQLPQPSWVDAQHDDSDSDIPEEFLDISSVSTVSLMEISNRMRAVRLPQQASQADGKSATRLPPTEVQWSPRQQRTDAFSINDYVDSELFGETLLLPQISAIDTVTPERVKAQSAEKATLNTSTIKVVLGLLVGIGMLLLVSRFVNITATLGTLKQHLTTPQGTTYALLAAVSFLSAFSIRGTRWRLFLSRISTIGTLKAIQVFWVAVFLNFLLPIQGGEVAKSLMLKRIERIPISRSLPTVAMDKALDLMPALIIMAAVPFISGVHMSITLWLILSLVGGILTGLIFVVALTAWNRAKATKFIQTILGILPKGIGGKLEGFALGFVDSLLEGASSPKTFIPAVLLTGLAVTCDGLFAMFAFLTVGVKMTFGAAIFGYTTYNMFCILPTPPGQVGSNELVGVLVFSGLLGFKETGVLAMFLFSHPLAALIMSIMCVVCLSSLGITLSSTMKVHNDGPRTKPARQGLTEMSPRTADVHQFTCHEILK
ncbi:MAG: flippase-like domain-containing protein [Ktedonobacteraceae bacterium]|nr:flippase-like domain-containing protein [Ktedonobacteraceae bacterium]